MFVPALATRYFVRWCLAASYALGALGYAAGLALSLWSDLPAGPLIVCTLIALGIVLFALGPRRAPV